MHTPDSIWKKKKCNTTCETHFSGGKMLVGYCVISSTVV